jgi:hypothetical protein
LMQSPLCELFPVQMRAIEQAVRETVRSCHNGLVISEMLLSPWKMRSFAAPLRYPHTHAPTHPLARRPPPIWRWSLHTEAT